MVWEVRRPAVRTLESGSGEGRAQKSEEAAPRPGMGEDGATGMGGESKERKEPLVTVYGSDRLSALNYGEGCGYGRCYPG